MLDPQRRRFRYLSHDLDPETGEAASGDRLLGRVGTVTNNTTGRYRRRPRSPAAAERAIQLPQTRFQ
jgi:hypothetical protein